MKKRYLIVVVFLIVFLFIGIFLFIRNIRVDREKMEDSVSEIRDSYQSIRDSILNYNQNKSEIQSYLASYYQDKFKKEYEFIYELFLKNDEVIHLVEVEKKQLDKDCIDKLYREKEVNTMCSNYGKMYQELVSSYQQDITNFQKFINLYNESANDQVDMFTSKYLNLEEDKS